MSELLLHRINTHFLCDLCGARQATKPGLKKHCVKIHKRNSRSFVCGIDSCTFEIAQDYNLRKLYRHIRFQHMDYFSACRVCKKTFDKLRNLRRHESEVHNVGTHSSAEKKMCLHCGYSTTGSNMNTHVRNMHTIHPTLKWSTCNFETRNGYKRLKKHEQLHLVERLNVICVNIQPGLKKLWWSTRRKYMRRKKLTCAHHGTTKPQIGTHLKSLNYKCANVIKLSIFLQHFEIKEMKKFSFCKDVKQI